MFFPALLVSLSLPSESAASSQWPQWTMRDGSEGISCKESKIDMSSNVDQCFKHPDRNGWSSTYKANSYAVCRNEDACKVLCASRLDCHSVDMHKSKDRCYLNSNCDKVQTATDYYMKHYRLFVKVTTPTTTMTASSSQSPQWTMRDGSEGITCKDSKIDMSSHVDQCFKHPDRNGWSSTYKANSSALCRNEDACKILCASRLDCHSVDMHKSKDRCYLNSNCDKVQTADDYYIKHYRLFVKVTTTTPTMTTRTTMMPVAIAMATTTSIATATTTMPEAIAMATPTTRMTTSIASAAVTATLGPSNTSLTAHGCPADVMGDSLEVFEPDGPGTVCLSKLPWRFQLRGRRSGMLAHGLHPLLMEGHASLMLAPDSWGELTVTLEGDSVNVAERTSNASAKPLCLEISYNVLGDRCGRTNDAYTCSAFGCTASALWTYWGIFIKQHQ